MEEYELNLGDLVQDRVTGIKGIATSKTTFLNGCIQVEVTPRLKLNDLSPEKAFGINIDIQQVKRMGKGINDEEKEIKKESNGGPITRVGRKAY